MIQTTAALLHARIDGRSVDVPFEQLDLGLTASDAEIKRAVARCLHVPEFKLRDYIVDRHETGNFTVRPQAVFG